MWYLPYLSKQTHVYTSSIMFSFHVLDWIAYTYNQLQFQPAIHVAAPFMHPMFTENTKDRVATNPFSYITVHGHLPDLLTERVHHFHSFFLPKSLGFLTFFPFLKFLNQLFCTLIISSCECPDLNSVAMLQLSKYHNE